MVLHNIHTLRILFLGLSHGASTRPQMSNLEESTDHLSNTKSQYPPMDPGPLTPPHTYEHDSNLAQLEMWQTHQRPLNRQTSDITYDREKQLITRRHQDTEHSAHVPGHEKGDGLASLPPSGPPSALHIEGVG